MGSRTVRTASFGQPPKGHKGHENEVLNPGRYQYCAASSMGYYDTVFDPWSLVWIDELFRQTPELLNDSFELPDDYDYPAPYVNRGSEEPDYNNGWMLNRKNSWQSGPPVNSTVADNSVPGAGYWTKKGGPHSAGDKEPGFQIYTKNPLPIQLFNMGHGNIASEAGSAETNVIGWDGYLSYDAQGAISATTQCNIGIPHAYAMYTLDMSLDVIRELIAKLEDWVENNTDPDGDGNTAFSYLTRILKPGPEVRTPSIKVIIRIIKILKKVLEQAGSDGIIGGKLVNWDFICELTHPTEANEYLYPKDQDDRPGNGGTYDHGKGGPHGPERFSYLISPEAQVFLAVTSLRANGVLWHISSQSGGLRYRIVRTFNFAHIHALTATDRLDHRLCGKMKQVLSYWNKNDHPDSIVDTTRKLDNRG